MTKRAFVYIGGKDTDGSDLPGTVTIFGTQFRMDTPVELDSDTFPGGRDKFDHAVSKLGKHPHFEVFE